MNWSVVVLLYESVTEVIVRICNKYLYIHIYACLFTLSVLKSGAFQWPFLCLVTFFRGWLTHTVFTIHIWITMKNSPITDTFVIDSYFNRYLHWFMHSHRNLWTECMNGWIYVYWLLCNISMTEEFELIYIIAFACIQFAHNIMKRKLYGDCQRIRFLLRQTQPK